MSPIKDRTPKRHTSASNPPYGSLGHLSQAFLDTREWSPTPQTRGPPTTTLDQASMGTTEGTGDPVRAEARGALPTGEVPELGETTSTPRARPGLMHPETSYTLVANDSVRTESMVRDGRYPGNLSRHISPESWDELMADSPPRTPDPLDGFPQTHRGNPAGRDLSHADLPRTTKRGRGAATENNVTTNTKGLKRTAEPNGGWPQIHLISTPWENVAAQQVEAWGMVGGVRLWARTFRAKYESNSLQTVDLTREIIANLVRIDSDVTLDVSFPLPMRANNMDHFPIPYHMLVSGLTEMQVDYLAGLGVVSTQEGTVFFRSFQDPRPSFVATVRFGESKDILAHVKEASPLQGDAVMNKILGGIAVKFIEVKRNPSSGGNFHGWNVYLQHSSLGDKDHVRLIKIMQKCDFPTATSGYGALLCGKDTLLCIGCKSIDHDTPNCPFLDIPGWMGPKPSAQPVANNMNTYDDEALTFDDNPAYYQGRGRGRGGGRGRRHQQRRNGRGFWG
ncbi:hypothetical protein C0992_004818 [Termitomyces sp. T32_za158]|nr:hypothetical protein C0992_004818 [Termitomyces sp. T32_za158]